MLLCKICKIPLKDNSYYLGVYKKEEIVCPNEDKHGSIINKRLEKDPFVCPVCNCLSCDEETQNYEDGELIKSVTIYTCNNCSFYWTLTYTHPEIDYEMEQLNEYGEWE
jgi:hypothetical protein